MKFSPLSFALGMLLAAGTLAYIFAPTVQAAPVDVEDCTPIAKLGLIVLARCIDPDTGAEIYMNSVGFMVFEP